MENNCNRLIIKDFKNWHALCSLFQCAGDEPVTSWGESASFDWEGVLDDVPPMGGCLQHVERIWALPNADMFSKRESFVLTSARLGNKPLFFIF